MREPRKCDTAVGHVCGERIVWTTACVRAANHPGEHDMRPTQAECVHTKARRGQAR